MELTVTESFEDEGGRDGDDTAWAVDRMKEQFASVFSDIEYNSVRYGVTSASEDEVVVEAAFDWIDARALFERTDGWRAVVFNEARENVYIGALSIRRDGVRAKGSVTVRLDPDECDTRAAFESEAQRIAMGDLKTSFTGLSDLSWGRVIETDLDYHQRIFEVRYTVKIPYRVSVLGLQTQRQAFRQLAVPGDWETVAKTC